MLLYIRTTSGTTTVVTRAGPVSVVVVQSGNNSTSFLLLLLLVESGNIHPLTQPPCCCWLCSWLWASTFRCCSCCCIDTTVLGTTKKVSALTGIAEHWNRTQHYCTMKNEFASTNLGKKSPALHYPFSRPRWKGYYETKEINFQKNTLGKFFVNLSRNPIPLICFSWWPFRSAVVFGLEWEH